jgi:Rieske Fe-S protein
MTGRPLDSTISQRCDPTVCQLADTASDAVHTVPRRSALIGAGVLGLSVLAGCSTYGGEQQQATVPEPPAAGVKGKEIAQVADIPLSGGKVLPDQNIVITQPNPGVYKAFSATCTHQGCKVARVGRDTIDCLCHGSKFGVADGLPKAGPAKKPLAPVNVVVDGAGIRLA